MTYYYDDYVEKHYGLQTGFDFPRGTYIMPNGEIFDLETYASIAHAGGFVIPFFNQFVHPRADILMYYTKEEILANLLKWEQSLTQKNNFSVHPKELRMRLDLVKYLINIYKSKYSIWDNINEKADISIVTGLPSYKDSNDFYGRQRFLKDILVRACNYDAIESNLNKGITTSKFNIYETFYDYILHDYKIIQIPKSIYDEKTEKYIDWKQNKFFLSDKELRLRDELEAIKSCVPLEERASFCRAKTIKNKFDFIN